LVYVRGVHGRCYPVAVSSRTNVEHKTVAHNFIKIVQTLLVTRVVGEPVSETYRKRRQTYAYLVHSADRWMREHARSDRRFEIASEREDCNALSSEITRETSTMRTAIF
jgi:hypothetical protein